jgi:hypothetical protein
MTTKIVTALRVSDSYKEEYVDLLYKQCQKYAPNSEFICISNSSNVPGYVKANHDWENGGARSKCLPFLDLFCLWT